MPQSWCRMRTIPALWTTPNKASIELTTMTRRTRDDGARAWADGQDDRRFELRQRTVPYIALEPLQSRTAGSAK
jgi:hypothetical protein